MIFEGYSNLFASLFIKLLRIWH